MMADDAPDRRRRQIGRRRLLQGRQVAHVVVDRRQRAGGGVPQHLIDAAFGLAGEQGAAEIERLLEVGGALRQHRQHADTWKPPITTLMPAARSGRARSRARGNWFDWTRPARPCRSAMPADQRNDVLDLDARVGLVDRRDVEPTSEPSARRRAASSASV